MTTSTDHWERPKQTESVERRVSQEALECIQLYCFELNNMLMTIHVCSYTCVQMTPLQFNTNP